MKKKTLTTFIAIALSSAAVMASGTAMAASNSNLFNNNLYVRGGVGGAYSNLDYSSHWDDQLAPYIQQDFANNGKDFSALGEIALGYSISPSFRMELAFNDAANTKYQGHESYYRHFGQSEYTMSKATDLKLSQQTVMLNGYFQLPTESKLTPYLMTGIGVARQKISGSESFEYQQTDGLVGKGTNNIDANHTAFAAQIGAGVSYPITDHLSVDAQARIMKTANWTFSGSTHDQVVAPSPATGDPYTTSGTVKSTTAMALLSVIYTF